PFLHLHHEDAAGGRPDQGGAPARQGLGGAESKQGRPADEGAGAADRRDEAGGSERARRRAGRADHRGDCAVDGRRGGALMAAHGKTYRQARAQIDRERVYSPAEAIRLLKSFESKKFDETVEVHFSLGLNVRHAEQQLRGTISLPNGTGKEQRVAVFAEGEKAREAEEAGADVVGAADLAKRVEEGFTDFDVAVATPDLMGQVGRLGRVLGPRGLMPNPKTGTVTTDVGRAVTEFKGGRVEYRTDKVGNVHVPVGKVSFDKAQPMENFRAVVDEIQRVKPAAAKGRYVRSVTLSSTMGPGVKIDPARLRVADEEMAASA